MNFELSLLIAPKMQDRNIIANRVQCSKCQGSKLTIASSKFATKKSHLLPVKKVGSKKLLPGIFFYESNFLEAHPDLNSLQQ